MAKLNYDCVYRTMEPYKYHLSMDMLEKTEDLCALVKIQNMLKDDYGYADINIAMLVYSILYRLGQGEKIIPFDNISKAEGDYIRREDICTWLRRTSCEDICKALDKNLWIDDLPVYTFL